MLHIGSVGLIGMGTKNNTVSTIDDLKDMVNLQKKSLD